MGYSTVLKIGTVLLTTGLALAGCAGPERNAMLEEARAAYATASNEPLTVGNAPLELKQAGDSLQRAQDLWESKADMDQVTHQAYIARQQTAIAQEAAQLKVAQEKIGQADVQRQQVLLEARSREAQSARQRAEAGERELAQTQRQVEQSRQQAQQVQQEAELARQEAARKTEELRQIEQQMAELQAQQTPRGIVLTLKDVVFEVDKAEIKGGADRTIDKIASFLQEHPDRSVLVEGFTDSLGPEEYNQKLSDQRAQAVAAALIAKGIAPERIQTRGYGEDYPVASNQNPAGRQLNRRVEIVISNGERVSMQAH